MSTYSTRGKARFRSIVAKKLGSDEEAISRFVRRAKSKFSRKSDAIGQIKAHLRDGDIDGAKKLCLSRLNEKVGLTEKALGNHVARIKGKTATKSISNFKEQLRSHLA